jgi:hypothetical protein
MILLKLKIRKGVFETNSSSSHSLIVKKEGEHYTHEEMLEELRWSLTSDARERESEGEWRMFPPGTWAPYDDFYFGRSPFELLVRFRDKLRYAFANAYNEDLRKGVMDVLNKLVPECVDVCISDYAGTDDNLLFDWLDSNGISLEDFLTDRRYVVVVDGDEYCVWDGIKELDLIDMSKIEKEI